MVSDGYKVKLLTVYGILDRQTDENNPLSAESIAKKASAKMRIKVNRKGVYDDIDAINDYFYKVDDPRRIEKDSKGRGYYLTNRPFSGEDVKMMVDVIEASKYLSATKTLKLIEAVEKLCPIPQVQDTRAQLVVFDRVKNMNNDIHKSLGKISSAIANNHQIRFKYFDYDINKKRAYRKKGMFYQMSPYELVYVDDNYYLVAYNAEKGIRNTFRVDRMANIAIVLQDRDGKELFGDKRDEKLRLQKSTFSMFDGKVKEITMVFRNNMMNAVIDRFGSDVFATKEDDDHFRISVPVAISQQFYGWIFGLGNYVTVVSPPEVRNEIKKKLEEIHKRYED